jgi:tRNA A-37 threonylcarbamoyl transferase component Bud32
MPDRKPSTAPPSSRKYDEDAPTQVEDLQPPIPRATGRPPPPAARVSVGESSQAPESESSPTTSAGATSASSVVTARETLGLSEIHRSRAFLRIAIVLALVQGLSLFAVSGDAAARDILLATAALVVVVCVAVAYLIRSDENYRFEYTVVAAYATIAAVFAGVYFYGVFSPAAVIVPFGVYFFCAGQSARASVAVYVTCAALYAILGVGVLTGAFPDRGIIRGDGAPLLDRAVILAIVEGIFLSTYLVARNTRATMLFAIERHDVVVRSLAQRDALLHEARHELVQAMRVGGVGRFSGEVVGSFRLGTVIGRGAMGEVYEAKRLDSNDRAAVKLIHPQLLVERDIVDRFFREAKITSSLDVANVVRVLEASPADAPIPYLAMERLVGDDLATILRDNKRLGMRRLLTLLRQVGVGLDAAHAAGIVHRDLKPRNLFCARAERGEIWKILDFGVSKLDTGEGTLTKGQIVGTPAYMAPEQARAMEVGPRADIFALGVIAYRALTGAPPFSGDTSVEILFKISHGMPQIPSSLARLPEQVDLVLAIALAKAPDDRFASGGELAQALDAASHGRLEGRLQHHARALLADLPWGAKGAP